MTPNILDLLNVGSPGISAGLSAGGVPGFAPGAAAFGASTVPGISSSLSWQNLMPLLGQILGGHQNGVVTLPSPIVAQPGQNIPMRLIGSNPNFPSWFGQNTLA